MKRFDRVKQILDEAIGDAAIGAHGAFWRPLDLPAFKAKKVYGKQLVVAGDVGKSNLILALRGESPFGADIGVAGATYPRMPARMPPVPNGKIDFIAQWVADGCPDDEAQAGP